jgi:hypothetical protein
MMSPSLTAVEELNADVVRRYLRVFETFAVADLEELVDPEVVAHGAGQTVHGRRCLEDAVLIPGISACRVRIDDLFSARDRVTVSFTLTYTQARTGRDLIMTGTKSYQLRGGRIVEFWGETDVFGFLRQAGLVPDQFPPL